MPKLRTKDILDFKSDSLKIKPDELYPIKAYLKIQFKDNYCSLTKHGNVSFVQKNIPAECSSLDGIILVDESNLFKFAETASQDFIEITPVNNRIKLEAGSYKTILATDDLSKFPSSDTLPVEWNKLFMEALTTIGICVAFIEETSEKSIPVKTHIFCRDKHICASNGNIAFVKELTDKVPEMILRREVAAAISGLQGAEHASSSSYDFFKSENILFGFRKSESNFYDLTPFGNIESKDISFMINKEDLIKYNDWCINSTKNKVVSTSFKCKSPTELELLFNDPDSGVDEFVGLITIQNGSGQFTFRPNIMNSLLRSIPSTHCLFYPGKNKYYVTDEQRSFVSLIMGVI